MDARDMDALRECMLYLGIGRRGKAKVTVTAMESKARQRSLARQKTPQKPESAYPAPNNT